MNKLRLNLEHIVVDSFTTHPASEPRGTVMGRADNVIFSIFGACTNDVTCPESCQWSCGASCGPACETRDIGTCQNVTQLNLSRCHTQWYDDDAEEQQANENP